MRTAVGNVLWAVAAIVALVVFLPAERIFADDGELILRNDAVPLSHDLKVGRFGIGDLYFDDPVDLAVDEDENVYILDSGNYRVQVMDEDGDFLNKWGRKGYDDGEFRKPVALAVDRENEYIYVLDRERYLVQKFGLDGSFKLSFGRKGIRKGKFNYPVDITVDFQGYVYVLDRDRGAVLKFHPGGTFVDEWGDIGRKKDEFSDPVSIAFSDVRLGSIYVLDLGKRALVKFDRKGRFKETIPIIPEEIAQANPIKIRADQSGNLFILESKQVKLLKLRRSTYSVFSLVSERLRMKKTSGLAIDGKDRIYVTDLGKDRVVRYRLELE